MSIGNNIKMIRKEKKITQSDLADQMGISRSYLGDLENDRRNPSATTLESLAKKLDVSMTYLLEGKKTMEDVFKHSAVRDLAEKAVDTIGKEESPQVQDNENVFSFDLQVNSMNYKISGIYFLQKSGFLSVINPTLFVRFEFDIDSDVFWDVLKNVGKNILKHIDYKQDKKDEIPIVYFEPTDDGIKVKKLVHINI